jgi:RHS repeat-associated protein
MTISTSVHSNAFNFMSFLQNGVDPRTGQYTVSITLPELKTNQLRGPGMPLTLSYNPLNNQDSGYGLGWNLQLSQVANNIVSLSSGETFQVTGTESGSTRLLMKEQKIVGFRLYKQDDTHYRLVHKSGLVEILELRGSSGNQVALPVRILAPEGHGITLEYRAFNSTYQILSSIKDDSGQTLLSLSREDFQVLIELHAADGPPVPFIMNLATSHRYATEIVLPVENQASWRFTYAEQRGLMCMETVDTPVGGHERIYYQDGGHPFPATSGRDPLPRVTRHLSEPGFGQPQIDVLYAYKDNLQRERNFLGAGLPVSWDEDGQDNLYKHVGAYEYHCTETLHVADQQVRTIERVFNQFHLLARETTTQNDNERTEETHYGLKPDTHFENQDPDCQLPKEVITTWRVNNTSRFRSETVSSRYDIHGNLVEQTQANGVVEESKWYPAEGTDGCPPDPEGFVRNVQEKIVRPAASEHGQAPTLCTRYRYMALPAITGSQGNDWLTAESEKLVKTSPGAEEELQNSLFEYINDPDDAFAHGRIERQTLTMGGLATTTGFEYDTLLSPIFGESVQRTVQTLTGFDGEQKVITLEHSMLTGEPLLNRDDNDVEIRYAYDSLRRVVRETVAPGTDDVASRNYEYFLCATVDDQAEQWMFDVKEVKTCTRFDGLNRVVYEERADADNPAQPDTPRQTYSARYDGLGNLSEETEFDWLDEQALALKTVYEYDDWNEQYSATGPDGVKKVEQTDPIGTINSRGPIQESWSEDSAAPSTQSGKTVTWLNLFEKPTRIERRNLDNAVIGLSRYDYDGLGRSINEVVGLPVKERITVYAYDAFDRVVQTSLPVSAIVRREYAAHSSEDLPASISVEHNSTTYVLGTQAFDGLDRLVKSVVGGRERVMRYDPGMLEPKTVTTPGGQEIAYEYRPPLGSEPLQRRLPSPDNVIADYQYDSRDARLLQCEEQGEQLQREYFSTGELKSERRVSLDQHGKKLADYTMAYRYSRLGRLLSYTDVLGQEQTYEYDGQGRLESTTLSTIRSTFTYDGLGRMASFETRDSDSGQSLKTSLEYDALDREILRTFDLNGVQQQLEQVYDDIDDMTRRTLREGAQVIRNEAYQYDRRGRLTQYDCTEGEPPVDPYGNAITRQVFIIDGMDNLTSVLTTFAGGSNVARYLYENGDPVQLSKITNNNTGAGYPAEIILQYDLDGNLTRDEASRSLAYDALSRLIEVGTQPSGSQYRYDPLDTLSAQTRGGEQDRRFYRDGELANQIRGSQNSTFIRGGDTLLAERQTGIDNATLLLGIDDNNSVLREVSEDVTSTSAYSTYGYRSGPAPAMGKLGFNGELAEADSGWQLLGNGYRAYNPLLMRFHSPDSESPFGEGGVNSYAYCEGDPVNFTDPTGHSIGTFFSGLARIVTRAKTTASKIAKNIPAELKAVPKGKTVAKLHRVKPQDLADVKEVFDVSIKRGKSGYNLLKEQVSEAIKYTNATDSSVDSQKWFIDATDSVAKNLNDAYGANTSYNSLRANLTKPGITSEARRTNAAARSGKQVASEVSYSRKTPLSNEVTKQRLEMDRAAKNIARRNN